MIVSRTGWKKKAQKSEGKKNSSDRRREVYSGLQWLRSEMLQGRQFFHKEGEDGHECESQQGTDLIIKSWEGRGEGANLYLCGERHKLETEGWTRRKKNRHAGPKTSRPVSKERRDGKRNRRETVKKVATFTQVVKKDVPNIKGKATGLQGRGVWTGGH